jgi:hypothetical protein
MSFLLFKKGHKSWNWGMAHAAGGGHKELVYFFIQEGGKKLE